MKPSPSRKALALTLALAALAAGPLAAEARADPDYGKTYELELLHTNDHHGTLLPTTAGKSGAAVSLYPQGGLAEVAAYVNGERATNRQVLLLDAGDFNTGSALSNMFDAEPDILGYNLIGYDAVTFGNHEFDGSLDKLTRQIDLADFPFVSSNITTAEGGYLGGHRYLVKHYDGFTVGIFGLTTLETKSVAKPDASLTFVDEVTAAREVVDILRNREGVDIVIGLVHLGDVKRSAGHVTSPELAAAVPGIDILVDGHSHSYLKQPLVVGSTYIVTAYEWGKVVGTGRLLVREGKLVDFSWAPVSIGPDEVVTAMLAPYIAQYEQAPPAAASSRAGPPPRKSSAPPPPR